MYRRIIGLLFARFICWFAVALTIEDGSGCVNPGSPCSVPKGGVCTAKESKLSCECPASQTIVQHATGKVCQTKLLDIPCSRDRECQMVKNSVCTLYDARCVCEANFVYVPHRHQCKPVYNSGRDHQYCKFCSEEGGVCFKEEDLSESNGPLLTEGGSTFRLGCSCPHNRGVPRHSGGSDHWGRPVCSTKLRDIDDVCDNKTLLCRSKRAQCQKLRHTEADFRKCQCPTGHVPVYQPWLKYYECFEVLKKDLEQCRQCSESDPYGTCYSPSNYSSPGCLCPKRLSTPSEKGSKQCSRRHVSVTCGSGRMEVTFDPGYASPPYNELLSRLRNGESIAYIDGYSGDVLAGGGEGRTSGARRRNEFGVCQLHEDGGGLYKAVLRLDSDTPCGSRSVTVNRLMYQTDTNSDQKVLEATLRVLWNRNFYSYPDIVVDLMCTVTAKLLGNNQSTDSKINPRRGQEQPSNRQLPPRVVSGLALWLRVLNRSGFSINEIEEEEPIQLELLLRDTTDGYTRLMVKQCSVSAAPTTKSRGSTKLIDCGGSAVADSGFNASFQSTRHGGGLLLQQTGSFPAFRLGGSLPAVFFACTIRICRESEAVFCDPKIACKSDKMAKRSPDFGVKELDEEIRLVVAAKHHAKRSEISDAVCKYSMCLSTSQVIIIILILLVLLALLSGLVIVVYRRRIMVSAVRRLRMSGSAGAHDVAANDEDTPMQTPIDAIGKGLPSSSSTCLHQHPQHLQHLQHQQNPSSQGYRYVHPGGQHQQLCTTLPRIPIYNGSGSSGGSHATPVDTLDSGLGASVSRAYASLTLDRNGPVPGGAKLRYLDRCGHSGGVAAGHVNGAHNRVGSSSRPDICTCDRSAHSSYSITSSQV